MQVETGADNEAYESNTVGDILNGWAGRSQGWRGDPLAAPFVDYEREREVCCLDDGHAGVQGLVEVLWPAHLADDWQEG